MSQRTERAARPEQLEELSGAIRKWNRYLYDKGSIPVDVYKLGERIAKRLHDTADAILEGKVSA